MTLKERIHANRERILSTWEHLHTHPEMSWHEVNTTKYVAERMRKIGLEVHTFDDQTGAVAVWHNGEGPVIALRTDIDALWQEVDGVEQANHSCGHDAHMTVVIETVEALKEIGFSPRGTLKIIFQPAEEKGNGALSIIERGLVDDIDQMFGIHLRPIQEADSGQATPAILHGATTMLCGTIRGLQAHGARPHLGVNVIEAAAAMVQAIRLISLDPMIPHSAKVTCLQAGGSTYNLIPDRADFAIDIRAQTNEAMDELLKQVERAIQSSVSSVGATVQFQIEAKMVAAEPNPEMIRIAEDAIRAVLGNDRLIQAKPTPGGEDFHFYSLKRPRIKTTMLGLGCNLTPGLHHPKMTFKQDSLLDGIEIMAQMTIAAFNHR